mgnify:FL=1
MKFCRLLASAILCIGAVSFAETGKTVSELPASLRVAVFDMDVTPPIGAHMAYDPVVKQWELGLRARGVVLLGADAPIVLCAIDWIGLANEAHDAFRDALARAAGTTGARVAVHTLHQHDAPGYDFTTEAILREHEIEMTRYDGTFAREALAELERTVARALDSAQPLTHIGLGQAEVREVASNRRILGPDGKVRAMRFTSCSDPALRAEPEGLIDPVVSVIGLFNGQTPVAVLSYYATHPQSYYRTGIANPDFPGVARFFRELAVPDALHIHFTGAGGNIGAGKYNDGSKENRLILAERLADGMRRAWESMEKSAITPAELGWSIAPMALPPAKHLDIEKLESIIRNPEASVADRTAAASNLAWLRRCNAGHKIDITCLTLGRARVLHMPGELFVEYQLAAKRERPDLFVAMAAYGDYGSGYIGTTVAYAEGGYETSERASKVAPEVEKVLMGAIRKLLHP